MDFHSDGTHQGARSLPHCQEESWRRQWRGGRFGICRPPAWRRSTGCPDWIRSHPRRERATQAPQRRRARRERRKGPEREVRVESVSSADLPEDSCTISLSAAEVPLVGGTFEAEGSDLGSAVHEPHAPTSPSHPQAPFSSSAKLVSACHPDFVSPGRSCKAVRFETSERPPAARLGRTSAPNPRSFGTGWLSRVVVPWPISVTLLAPSFLLQPQAQHC